jgi:hypothetical protein
MEAVWVGRSYIRYIRPVDQCLMHVIGRAYRPASDGVLLRA